ncbi:heterokaryon incompatibility protein-domain-containing protein [Hyaloscypha sp. PMI_1271]|nr:heterokaryon incompatibility protein-domain-containing protein [Hyaloscypha sp. PMI_1271]
MNPYQYSPLRKDGKEFRLLSLLPGPMSANIELEIFHVNRSSNPKYEALSYVWRDPARTDTALPATIIGIAHNLAIALGHLRHIKKPRILWIDALCINQNDLPERSAEVLDMGSIYSNARQVIVWLGPSSSNSQLAIESLIRIGEGVNISDETRTIMFKTDSWAKLLGNNVDALKYHAPSWIAIRDLLHREWFSRLWVFQEIGLATNATVSVGTDCIDWQTFGSSLQWLWTILDHLNELIENLAIEDFASNSISKFLDLTERKASQYQSLYSLLNKKRKLYASDPRDRLYAIRGLAAPADRKCIVPDYSKNVEEVFKDFTLQLIQRHELGNILARCLLRATLSILQLPSWVPDLSRADRPMRFFDLRASGISKFVAVVLRDVGELHSGMQNKKRFEEFSCCYRCGLPQAICQRWWHEDEPGRFIEDPTMECQYGQVVIPVVAVILRMWPSMDADMIWAWMQDDPVNRGVPEKKFQWFGRKIKLGGMEASNVCRVFYRLVRMVDLE